MAKARHKKKKKPRVNCSFSDDKIEAMKQKARELSKMIIQSSKQIIEKQIASDECIHIKHNSTINNKSPQEDIEVSQNNDKISTLMNIESTNVPSCSKISIENTLPDTVLSPNSTSKKKHNKKLSTKLKKIKIPYLIKSGIYQEENVDDLTSKKQDDYVLEKLFNKSGIIYLTYGRY